MQVFLSFIRDIEIPILWIACIIDLMLIAKLITTGIGYPDILAIIVQLHWDYWHRSILIVKPSVAT